MSLSQPKKKRMIILIVIGCVVLLAVGINFLLTMAPIPLQFRVKEVLSQSTNVVYVDNGEEFPFLYKADSEGGYSGENLKILTFTDTHLETKLTSYSKNTLTIEMLKKNIETEKPDLIVFTGDIVTGIFTTNRLKGLADMLEAYGVYWAPVFGNHDGEFATSRSREEICEIWGEYEHCLLKKGDVDGYGNYIINIKTSATTVSQSLVFMDSGSYMSKSDKEKYGVSGTSYDYIKQSQIDWYKQSMSTIKARYGDTKSMLFIHIPLVEYEDAYEDGELLYGEKKEPICASEYNSGMFDAILEAGSTQAIFCGHDHVNDYDCLYQGVHFVYLQKSGYASYDLYTKKMVVSESLRRQGTNVITILSDGSFTNEPKLNTRFQ